MGLLLDYSSAGWGIASCFGADSGTFRAETIEFCSGFRPLFILLLSGYTFDTYIKNPSRRFCRPGPMDIIQLLPRVLQL